MLVWLSLAWFVALCGAAIWVLFFGLTFSGVDCMDTRTERVSPPTSFARKNADGFWYVAVTWGNGRKERLGPFKTEAAAEELIKRSRLHGMREKSISEAAAVTFPFAERAR